MRHFLIIMLFISTFSGCNEEIEKPQNLISRSEMKDVLKDIYLYKQVKTYKIDQNLPDISQVNLAVLDKHGITLQQFKDSYRYYVIDNAAYDELLTEIQTELEAELPQELDSLSNQKNKKSDGYKFWE